MRRAPAAGRGGAPARADDDGHVGLLVCGLTAVALACVVVTADAARVHLARHRLQSVADLAALHAASALDEAVYYGAPPAAGPDDGTAGPGATAVVPVGDASVREAVARHLADAAPPGLDALRVEPGTGTDGAGAVVRLSTVVAPLAGVAWLPGAGPVRVVVEARAVTVPR